jgi:ADP-ribose pyrophosphatase YjhB (NUDIX family)
VTYSDPRWPVSVKAVLEADGRILIVQNDRGEWELPGGRLEPGETPELCLLREIEEETCIRASCGDLLLVESFEVLPDKHVLIVAFGATAPAGAICAISDEHIGHGWFEPANLPKERLPGVYKRAIARWLAVKRMSAPITVDQAVR